MAKRTTRILIKDKLRRAATGVQTATVSLQQIAEVYHEHGHENYLFVLQVIEYADMFNDMLLKLRERV